MWRGVFILSHERGLRNIRKSSLGTGESHDDETVKRSDVGGGLGGKNPKGFALLLNNAPPGGHDYARLLLDKSPPTPDVIAVPALEYTVCEHFKDRHEWGVT